MPNSRMSSSNAPAIRSRNAYIKSWQRKSWETKKHLHFSLRKMEQLLGARKLEPSILKQLFMHWLPTNVQLILASTGDEVDITQLAKLEVAPPTAKPVVSAPELQPVAAVKQSAETEIQLLRAQVEKLTAQMTMLFSQDQNRYDRSQSRSNNRDQYRKRDDHGHSPSHDDNTGACWYHWKYGEKGSQL